MAKYETVEKFIQDGAHLPAPLKDFHDQKDVFKSLHDWFESRIKEDSVCKMPTWIEGHIYTIDYFLKFMALHGWTLQRSRVNVKFINIEQSIKEREEREYAAMREYLNAQTSEVKPSS